MFAMPGRVARKERAVSFRSIAVAIGGSQPEFVPMHGGDECEYYLRGTTIFSCFLQAEDVHTHPGRQARRTDILTDAYDRSTTVKTFNGETLRVP